MPASAACECALEVNEKGERGTLIVLLILNAMMFIVELVLGIRAESTALIADSLDMLADAIVYGVALRAVGWAASKKRHVTRLCAGCQVLLALVVLADIIRAAVVGSAPESWLIIGVGIGALVVNVICLALISNYRTGGVHIKATFIFTQSDAIANLLTIIAGIVILLTDLEWFDLLAGGIVIFIFLYSSAKILRLKEPQQQFNNCSKPCDNGDCGDRVCAGENDINKSCEDTCETKEDCGECKCSSESAFVSEV